MITIEKIFFDNLFTTILALNFIFFLVFHASGDFLTEKLNIIKKKKFKSNKLVPLSGGYFIFFSIIIFYFSTSLYPNQVYPLNIYLFIAITLIFLFGIIDDKYDIKPLTKTIISCLIFLFFLFFNQSYLINELNIYNLYYILKIPLSFMFTILCLFILQNSINFSDGVNGVSLTIILSINLILFYYNLNSDFSLFLIIFVNIVFFSLILNVNNNFFLGDAGVNILSFLTSLNIIFIYNQNLSILTQEKIFLYLLLPGIDLIRMVFERLVKRINPTKKDANHLHHLLYEKFGQKLTLFFYLFSIILSFLFCEILEFKVIIVIMMITVIYFSLYVISKK